MYTLRIIDQSKVGTEKRENTYLGNSYEILMKTPIVYQANEVRVEEKEGNCTWSKALKSFKEYSDEYFYEDDVVGFVYGNGEIHPIREYNVVYIVGSEGQTVERVYGQYIRY